LDINSAEIPSNKIYVQKMEKKKRHRLRMFKNRVLRRIFESRRDEVTGDWRKLHNEELQNLY
jgi:hypothetical protein